MEEGIGIISITQPAGTLFGPPSKHQILIEIAYRLFDGVKVMGISSPCPDVALAFVTAQTLECLLKAYIAKVNPDENLEYSKIRHNLRDLWEVAYKCGFKIDEDPPDWGDQLTILHDRPFYLRGYLSKKPEEWKHVLMLVPAEPMTSQWEDLLSVVATKIK